jgi:spore coat polysaccharide biosynthesis predicted glycosyltransferase SpsG
MGGTDPTGSAFTVGQACADAFPTAVVTVVAPTAGPDQDPRLTVVPRIVDMATAMLGSDLVVSAGGSTVWELCCLARPAATVQVATNQADVYQRLTSAGVVVGLGAAPVLRAEAARRLRAMVARPDSLATLARAASELVDGRGAERVMKHLDSILERQRP